MVEALLDLSFAWTKPKLKAEANPKFTIAKLLFKNANILSEHEKHHNKFNKYGYLSHIKHLKI